MRALALLAAALLPSLLFSGCAEKEDGPTKEELSHMITRTKGAIAGTVLDRNNKTMNTLNVKLFITNTNEKYGELETDYKGRFYFRQLFPAQYKVSVNLKDWTDCIVTVKANQFTNITIRQPVYPHQPKSC